MKILYYFYTMLCKAIFISATFQIFHNFFSTESGWWSVSGNPLSINKKSGVSAAVAVGSTMVYYNEATFTTHTEVTHLHACVHEQHVFTIVCRKTLVFSTHFVFTNFRFRLGVA